MASTKATRSGEADRYLAHHERGVALYLQKDYDGALASVAQMAALNPDDPRHLHLHAHVAYARREFAESIRLCELASARDPDYYEYHGLAADAALRLADHTRALHHVHAALACGRVPPMPLLSFVVMEGAALVRLERRHEAAERLMTLDSHPAIQALVAESRLDDFKDAIAGLYGDELSPDKVNDHVAFLADSILHIARLWLLLKEDRGGPLLRALLRRQPDRYAAVEQLVQSFNLDPRRCALHGIPDPNTCTTAPAPGSYPSPPSPPPNAKPAAPAPDSTVPGASRVRLAGPAEVHDNPRPPRPPLDAIVPDARKRATTHSKATGAKMPTIVPCDVASQPQVCLKNPVGFIEQLQSELKDALVEHQAHVLVRVLQKRLDTLTFGDLRAVMDSRLGQGLASILVQELVTVQAPSPVAEPQSARKSKTTQSPRKRKTKAAALAAPRTKSGSAKTPGRATPKTTAKAASKATTAKAASKTTAAKARPPKVSALTVAGRESYDNALIQFLRSHPGFNRPSDMRMVVGGTKLQLRSAMQRLMKAGVVERQGSHSTTRYAAKTV